MMSTVGKTGHATGWSAVGILATITVTKALTALVVAFPLAWLVNQIFWARAIHAIFGSDRLSYWRCVGLFAIWFAARVRIKFSGPAQIKVEGDL
jgi:uncharacterized membrane protein YecN with MAPEG domain